HEGGDVKSHRSHGRREAPRLRAEVAILGTAAGLDGDDPLYLDFGATPSHAHLVSQRERLADAIIRQCKHLDRLRLSEPLAAFEHLFPSDGEDIPFPHANTS